MLVVFSIIINFSPIIKTFSPLWLDRLQVSFKHQTFLSGFKSTFFCIHTEHDRQQVSIISVAAGGGLQWLAHPLLHISAVCSPHWSVVQDCRLQQRPEAATSLLSDPDQSWSSPAHLGPCKYIGARKETSYCSHDHSPCSQLLAPI